MFPSVAFLSGTRLYGYSAGVASKDRFSFEFLKSDFTILNHAILPRKSRKRLDMNLFLVHQQPKTKSPSQLLPRKSGSCFGRFSPFGYSLAKVFKPQSLPIIWISCYTVASLCPPSAVPRTCLPGENSFSDSSYLAPNVYWQRTGRC